MCYSNKVGYRSRVINVDSRYVYMPLSLNWCLTTVFRCYFCSTSFADLQRKRNKVKEIFLVNFWNEIDNFANSFFCFCLKAFIEGLRFKVNWCLTVTVYNTPDRQRADGINQLIRKVKFYLNFFEWNVYIQLAYKCDKIENCIDLEVWWHDVEQSFPLCNFLLHTHILFKESVMKIEVYIHGVKSPKRNIKVKTKINFYRGLYNQP